ncbi:protoporphyrinogen/coproporphyrinogen oxidase [Streptomyces monticola]|uniref:Protoporphyrinogen/coproporphyrinogen oxidase n=1 Tax=Streptomyces monticola TaxID=2666263 RepID=A0ABW2JUB7_9ACTN
MTGQNQRIIVIGGGIAGLTAAFRLQRAGFDVTVLERSESELIGGRMSTVERKGFHIDVGATLLLSSYEVMIQLAVDAGLAHQIRPAGDVFGIFRDAAVQRISSGNRLHMLRSPLLRALPARDLLKVAADFGRARNLFGWHDMSRAAPADFESVRDYTVRRGLHPATFEYLLAPFVAGPALAEPEQASALSAFFFFNTLIASGGTFTTPQGVGFLPRGLAGQLPVEYLAEATSVEEHKDEVTVTWNRPGEPEHIETAAACVIAVPPPRLPGLYPQLDDGQRTYLQDIAYSRSVHIAFGLDRPTAESSLLLQIPRIEHPELAAYVLEHNQHPDRVPPGTGLVMAHFRGTWSADHWALDDEQVVKHALAGTRRLGVLPELERHMTMAEVFRVSPCTVMRRPGEYRAIARFARTLRGDTRVRFAGGDFLAHSTTNSSVCSGEHVAAQLTRFLHKARTDQP